MAVCVFPISAVRTWYPLREAALRLQHVLCATVPGEHVPTSGEWQSVQLATVQPLQQQQHTFLQQDQVRWAEYGSGINRLTRLAVGAHAMSSNII